MVVPSNGPRAFIFSLLRCNARVGCPFKPRKLGGLEVLRDTPLAVILRKPGCLLQLSAMQELQAEIERLYSAGVLEGTDRVGAREVFLEFRDALTRGLIRAAEKRYGQWQVNTWVKQGILLGFRLGELEDMSGPGPLPFVDKSTFPVRGFTIEDKVRVVPGGSSVRSGAYLAPGVIAMPPMYVNAGAYVDEGTLIDSHALVGSCAQVGRRVHLSAAAQIGGVLEPVNASPVIIEDDVL